MSPTVDIFKINGLISSASDRLKLVDAEIQCEVNKITKVNSTSSRQEAFSDIQAILGDLLPDATFTLYGK